ncbi:BamA/TamA family outer membrane protein [Sphingobacterium sp. SRCM116780]|uniref:BamA/TamA family outer membrane protein n=1 Tax=Sphingobacterium sp. SRCM116780 TaxID=2907623 RepID=UPI001F2A84D8|nr:BamA/TamA family outer membrane protein [Sphingobacterium sp. SRCM116780]UIR56929.1 BamA/TamA family outer membrane protein [Sphingobacterium sp. SRCM116780]
MKKPLPYLSIFKIILALVMLITATFVSKTSQAQIKFVTDSSRIETDSSYVIHQIDSNSAYQYDIADLFSSMFHPKRPKNLNKKRSGLTLMPGIALNPTIGAQIGIKGVAGVVLGDKSNTTMSTAASTASVTTKGIMVFYVSHNIYTRENKWNIQGGWAIVKMVNPDAGLGMTKTFSGETNDDILTNPNKDIFVYKYTSLSINEKLYKRVSNNLFLGAGFAFDIRRNIKSSSGNNDNPNYVYSKRYGFDPEQYNSNALLFNVQYMTRDNPNRAYKGIYTDVGIRMNQEWMGSSKNALQLTTDFRKYFSLSDENPEHVLAFWNYGSYRISGRLPYLDLPGTAKDATARSGRGYTLGFFKGLSYFYNEVEYRFPILRNKFLSGATFFNIQSTNNDMDSRLFQSWRAAGGAGLRVLFNKATRTNLCIDYAIGGYNRRGLFLGLNESF